MKKILYKVLFIAVVAILTIGCATPRYKTADNIVSETTFRNSPSDTTTIASMKWDIFYGDKYLRALINESLEKNINLQLAISQIKQAEQYLMQSKAAFAPNFNISGNATFVDPSQNGISAVGEGVKTPISDYTITAAASWELDIWGKISSAKRAAYARFLASDATKDAVVTNLIAEIASAYYQLVVLDAKLEVTEKTIGLYSDYLEKVEIMKNQGQTNEVAVLQAKAQLYGAQSYLPEVKTGIVVMENYISLLLGRSGGTIERGTTLDLESINLATSTGVPAQLLQYRPDVRAAELSMRAAHESFNVARASMYPSLTISGSAGYESMEVENWFNPNSVFWNVVGGVTAPLFNARALRTQKRVAALQKEDSYLNFKLSLINAMMEVSNSLLSVNSAAEKAKYVKSQYSAVSKAFEYSIELFESGYVTYLDVLSAQNGLFASELSLYDSYLQVATQRIELYRALGGGQQH